MSEGQTQLSQLHIATSGKQAAYLLYGDPYHRFNSRAAEAEEGAQVPECLIIPMPSARHLLEWATAAELSPPLATLYEGHSLHDQRKSASKLLPALQALKI